MPSKTTIKKDSFSNKDEKNKSNRRQSNEIETYVVEAILEKKKMNGIWKYKVKWMDYSEDECTWEPAGNLVGVQDMLNDFNERLKEDNIEEEKSNKEKESRKIDSTMKEKANKVKEKNSRKKEKKSDSKKERESISPAPKKKVKPNEEYNEYESDKKILGVSSYGHFELGDIPRRIIHSKKEKNSIIFTIEWMPRKNGKTPVNTEMTNLEIRKYDKNLLLDFYESHLKFIKPCPSKDIAKVSANKDNYQSIDLEEEEEEKQKERDNEEQINESREKPRQEISVDGDELQRNANDDIRANDPIQIEDDTSQKNSQHNQENQEDLDYQAEDVSEERHIVDDDKREENKPEETQEGIQNNEETIQKITFDSENMIDNGGQPIFADLGFNVADEIRDLALDEHLRVVSQTNPDITKPIENKENSLQNMEQLEKNEDHEQSEKNGDQEQSEKNEDQEQSEKNEDQEQSEKNEDQELQLESPKEISDSSSQVDPFLI